MTSIPVGGLFAPGLELEAEFRAELEIAAEFVAAAAELFDITAQAAEIKRQELTEARSAAQLADEAHERSGRTVDAANTKMRALLRAGGLVRTADGLVARPDESTVAERATGSPASCQHCGRTVRYDHKTKSLVHVGGGIECRP
jgi:hypothetical protein